MDRIDLKFTPSLPLHVSLRLSPQPGRPTRLAPDDLQLSAAARVASQAVPAPAMIPPLGRLDFYRRRHEDFVARHPELPPPSYYLDYGDKYIRRFTEVLNPTLTPAGQAWLAQARLNLQVAIATELARDPAAFDQLEQDDPAFKDFAYATHSKAYLDAGMAELPLKDLIKIGMTPDVSDLFTRAGLEQVVEVAAGIARARVRTYREAGLRMDLPAGMSWPVELAPGP